MPSRDAAAGFISWSQSDTTKKHPGRGRHSKGCLTCRKRRVKCDEARPTCQRCKSGFHACLGYEQPLIWVNQGVGTSVHPTTTSATQSLAKSTPMAHPASPASSSFYTRLSSGSDADSPGSATSSSAASLALAPWPNPTFDAVDSGPGSIPVLHFARTMPLDGFQDEIVISHMITKLSLGLSESLPQGTDAPTMATVLQPRAGPSAAYVAGLGLAEAFFGKVHKLDGLVNHSTLLYGNALSRLRSDLQNIDQQEARQRAYLNLWTSLFLGMYEIVSASSSSSWLEHCRGVSALTRALGPAAFQDPVANAMFQSNRSFITIGHIVMRKRCFLEETKWQTIPWANAVTPKSLSFQIQDVFCVTPGLMEDLDKVLAGDNRGGGDDDDVFNAKAQLQRKISDTIDWLAELRWRWEEEHPRVSWMEPTDPATSVSVDEQGVPIFASVLHFSEIDCAIDIVYFNAIRLLLYTLSDLAGLYDVSASYTTLSDYSRRQGPFSNPLLIPGQGNRVDHALEVCRAVDFLVHGQRDSFGAFILLFPLRVAYTHLSTQPAVFAWVQRILGTLATTKGFQLGKHITDLDSKPGSPVP